MEAHDSLGAALADLLPVLMAGYVLYSVWLGLGGATPDAGDALHEPAATSIAIAGAGLLIGFDRARRRASVRIGLGIFGCAFALTLTALELI